MNIPKRFLVGCKESYFFAMSPYFLSDKLRVFLLNQQKITLINNEVPFHG